MTATKDCVWLCVTSALAIGLATLYWKSATSSSSECEYCARCFLKKLPRRIICIRHAQSEGNVNPVLYRDIPDNAMRLTALGKIQAREAGKCIKKIVGAESVVRHRGPLFVLSQTYTLLVRRDVLFPHVSGRLKRLKK
jgi:hypothetical protein